MRSGTASNDPPNKYVEARLRLAAVNLALDAIIEGNALFDFDVVLDHAVELLDQVLRWLRTA